MKKEIKKIAVIGGLVMLVMFLFGGCGESPVAKVHYKGRLVQSSVMSGAVAELSWVDILEVYNPDRFKEQAQRISEDGKRANLWKNVDVASKDGIYYLYLDEKYLLGQKKSYILLNVFWWLIFTTGIYFLPKAIRKTEV